MAAHHTPCGTGPHAPPSCAFFPVWQKCSSCSIAPQGYKTGDVVEICVGGQNIIATSLIDDNCDHPTKGSALTPPTWELRELISYIKCDMDLTLTGTTLTIANHTNCEASIDLAPAIGAGETLTLAGSVLTLDNGNGGTSVIDLCPIMQVCLSPQTVTLVGAELTIMDVLSNAITTDLTPAIQLAETDTTLTITGDELTYIGEDGTPQVVSLTAAIQLAETDTTLTLVGTDLNYVGEDGTTQVIPLSSIIPAPVLTTLSLVDENLVYVDETGATNIIDMCSLMTECLTPQTVTVTGSSLVVVDVMGNLTTTILPAAGGGADTLTTIALVAGTLSYVDELGGTTALNLVPTTGAVPPVAAPAAGETVWYVDTSNDPQMLYYWDGVAWNILGRPTINLMTQDDPPRTLLDTTNNPNFRTIPEISGHYRVVGVADEAGMPVEDPDGNIPSRENGILHSYFDGDVHVLEYTDLDSGHKFISTNKAVTWRPLTCCGTPPACDVAVDSFFAELDYQKSAATNTTAETYAAFFDVPNIVPNTASIYKVDPASKKFAPVATGNWPTTATTEPYRVADGAFLNLDTSGASSVLMAVSKPTAGAGGVPAVVMAMDTAGTLLYADPHTIEDAVSVATTSHLAPTTLPTLIAIGGKESAATPYSIEIFAPTSTTLGAAIQTLSIGPVGIEVHKMSFFIHAGDLFLAASARGPSNDGIRVYKYNGTIMTQVGGVVPGSAVAENHHSTLSTGGLARMAVGNGQALSYLVFDGTNFTATGDSPSTINGSVTLVKADNADVAVAMEHLPYGGINGAPQIGKLEVWQAEGEAISATNPLFKGDLIGTRAFTSTGLEPLQYGYLSLPFVINSPFTNRTYIGHVAADTTAPATSNATIYTIC